MSTEGLKQAVNRRTFARRGLLALTGIAATAALVRKAQAAFGLGKVPTDMIISPTPSAALASQPISVAAQLWRLDGGTSGLAGVQAQFWAGSAAYASVNLGRYVAAGDGIFRFSFPAKTLNATGSFVLLADMSPTSASEGWIAAPRPYARFTVSRWRGWSIALESARARVIRRTARQSRA